MKKFFDIIRAIARTLLGLVFIFSGGVKAIDPLGTVYKIEDYLKAFGGVFIDMLPLAYWAALALITLEFILGICLVFNVKVQWTRWAVLVFMLAMTPLTLWIALTDPVSDCGCFGDAIVLSNWATFFKNIILTALVALLFVGSHDEDRHTWKRDTAIVSGGLIAVFALMGWTLLHLPLVDFRPYKIGNNIPELMEVPENAEQDIYEIRFIYEKDGKQQEFTLANYPKGDTTWTFVDQKSKLIQKGYEPLIHDFEIINSDYEDITYDLLESEEPVTLITMYDLDKTNRTQIDKVRTLLEQCDKELQLCYILTGSGEQSIMDFCWETGIDENRICTCDPVTLKTIVRANPGIFVIQNGNITDKYNLRNR